MTKVFGVVAWVAVMVIAIFGIARGQNLETLVLLCVSTAISAIPTGLPTFVQTMLSSGAQHLAAAKAVVKSLSDVETLGGTTVINSDKTGTLTLNAMTATTMLAGGEWFNVEGGGYSKSGAIQSNSTCCNAFWTRSNSADRSGSSLSPCRSSRPRSWQLTSSSRSRPRRRNAPSRSAACPLR